MYGCVIFLPCHAQSDQAPPTHQSARMTDNFGHCETDSDAPLPTLLPEATDSLPENALGEKY